MGILAAFATKEVVIHEYEVGLLYENGEFKKLLGTGLYRLPKEGFEKEIVVVDKRTKVLDITGQEILTKDKLNLRLNIIVKYKVIDPLKAIHEVESYFTSVYRDVQMSVRGFVSSKNLDEILSIRNIFDDAIKEEINTKCKKYGIEIESVELKDIILTGDIKAILMKEIEARIDGEAALTRARNEVASTRALINAANLIREHPEILELKIVEAIGKLAESGNNAMIPLLSEIFEKIKKRKKE